MVTSKKYFAFVVAALTYASCYAFFWNRNIDCTQDLNCEKLTTDFEKAWLHEVLDAEKIKKISKSYGFTYRHDHMEGKVSPYELGRNIHFEQRGSVFLTNTSSNKNKFNYVDIFNSNYAGGVAYFLIKNLEIENVNSSTDSKHDRYFAGILFVISEVGQVAIDYKDRSVYLTTSDYWDVGHRQKKFSWVIDKNSNQCGFRKGERVLPPC